MKYLTAKETAKVWQVSGQLVRRYCKEGRIPGAFQKDGGWLIPEDTQKPGSKKEQSEEKVPLLNQLRYQRKKNNHYGIYEYIQINLAYSSSRMASNRLTREQVTEIYRKDKVATAFEPMKVDDIIEIKNHTRCMEYVVDTLMEPLSLTYICRLHRMLTYGTYADWGKTLHPGEFRTAKAKLGIPQDSIQPNLAKLIQGYEKQKVTLDGLLEFHVRFERIHPFEDYNGRVGRILLMKECLRHGIQPFIFEDKRRGAYNRGIADWDTDPTTLKEVVAQAQERFKAKEELCKLMKYRRLPDSRDR